jgi:hypothetical protein
VRRLRELQPVRVAVGGTVVDCRVAALTHDEAALVITRLRRGTAPPIFAHDALLAFTHGPGLVVLKGDLRRGRADGDLRFTVTDGVQVPSPRRASRLIVRLPVTVRRGEGEPVETETADLSATGMGVRATNVGEVGERVGVDLTLLGAGTVGAGGRVVRRTRWISGLHLDEFEGDGRERLGEFVLACQRALATARS